MFRRQSYKTTEKYNRFLYILSIDRLLAKKTKHITLDLIILNEGSIEGTDSVIRNVFDEQYDLKHNNKAQYLRLSYSN